MSHGIDIYQDSEAGWYSAFASDSDFTRMVFAFAMSHDDAQQSIEAAFGPVGRVTISDGPHRGMPFIITESAQATRRLT